MRKQDILRMFLFAVLFSIGAAVLAGSALCDELLQYYRNNRLLKAAEVSLNRLKSLNADYDALLKRLQKDPNLIERIAPATLGTEPDTNANTVYPKARAEQLSAARKALSEDSDLQPGEPMIPDWLIRCNEPYRRTILFLAGAFLILISFIWFGSTKQAGGNEKRETTV